VLGHTSKIPNGRRDGPSYRRGKEDMIGGVVKSFRGNFIGSSLDGKVEAKNKLLWGGGKHWGCPLSLY